MGDNRGVPVLSKVIMLVILSSNLGVSIGIIYGGAIVSASLVPVAVVCGDGWLEAREVILVENATVCLTASCCSILVSLAV